MEVTALCIRLLVNVPLLLTAQIQNSSLEADPIDTFASPIVTVPLMLTTLDQDSYQKAETDEENQSYKDAVFLRVDPNRLQFFEYESISLSCADFHGPTEWRVMKNIPSIASQWETAAVLLNIKPAFKSHSGQYWCENEGGERSRALNITVTGGKVILDSPALPVIEQQAVALHCREKDASSNSPADFYKDGRLIKTDYKGKMNILNISISDKGLYKCEISGSGESPESWLAVRAHDTSAPQDSTTQVYQKTHRSHRGSVQLSVLLSVVFTVLCVSVLLLVVGLLHCRKHKVACFSSGMPTPGSDPVFEVTVADPHMAPLAVTKHKKKRGCQEAKAAEPDDVTYAVVVTKKREKGSGGTHIPDPDRTVYGVVANQRK
ncbi:Fc receptor-like protein 5 isoform X1 [Scomber scombrus]